MKRIFLAFLTICITAAFSNAGEFRYKQIEEKSNISYDVSTGTWKIKKSNKDECYFQKADSAYLYQGSVPFYTGCDYEFITSGKLIGYSNSDLKFYSIDYKNDALEKTELSEEEIQALLPNYRMLKLSEFSKNTNSVRIRKNTRELPLLLMNDINEDFTGYEFSSGNAKLEKYPLNGVVKIKKNGMVQFSNGCLNEKTPYVILVK